jgi:hypothetical protein
VYILQQAILELQQHNFGQHHDGGVSCHLCCSKACELAIHKLAVELCMLIEPACPNVKMSFQNHVCARATCHLYTHVSALISYSLILLLLLLLLLLHAEQRC